MPVADALGSLLDNLEEAVFATDAHGRFVYVNAAIERSYGYRPADLVGRHVSGCIHPDDRAAMQAAYERALAGAVTHAEVRGIDARGDVRDLRVAIRPRWDGEVVDGVDGVISDLSAVRDFERRMIQLHEHLMTAAFVFQEDGATLRLVHVNAAGRALVPGFGGALVGRAAADLEPTFPGLTAELERCRATRVRIRRELSCAGPDGGFRRLVLTYALAPPDAVILYADDVTRERDVEARLAAAQRLEAVGRLAGGIAHDFNNLLSVIVTYTGFALDALRPDDPVRDDLREVRDAGERAANLTGQLLAFSRKQILQPKIIALNKVVTGLQGLLRRLLPESLRIVIAARDDAGHVIADPTQLEQVIINLALNARDAMPGGGTLAISTASVELDESYAAGHEAVTPGRYVMLAVTDTGQGMDETTRLRVFEPFFTTKESGTGLGLATVYGIVKQSGGNVWVYSEPGKGTTFKVYLPQVDAPVPRAEPPGLFVATGRERVLVVEDEPAVRRLVERILSSAGYAVATAETPSQAIALAEERDGGFDVLVTDVVLPELNGRELAHRLSTRCMGLRTVYMSGYTDDAIVHHGVLDPGVRFVGKPFAAATLLRTVREAAEGR